MMAACRPHRVRLIGGERRLGRRMVLSLTLIGTVPPRKALFRNGARIGDSLYVTGTIGDALAGLNLLNEPPARVKRHSRTATLSSQAPAIFDRTTLAPNCARRGRPVAQHPWLRDLRD